MKRLFYYLWNLWPPFLGMGIAITHISKDFLTVKAKLKYRPWTRNYLGTQFGGSIFALTDPFLIVMLMHHFPGRYILWDKAADIDYKKPGRTDLYLTVHLSQRQLSEIETLVNEHGKIEYHVPLHVYDKNEELVATVNRVLYIRDKKLGRGVKKARKVVKQKSPK